MDALLPSRQFNQAKTQLSDVMNEVVREHHPYLIDRNRGRELMVLMEAGDLLRVLESFSFSTQVSISRGEFIARLPELNITADGESFDEALDQLVDLAEEYSQMLMDRYAFYAQTDRAAQLPWALRFALTPAEERRALLVPGPAVREASAARAAVAPA